MKRFSFLFSLLLCIMASAQAQTYTKHLQEKRDGKANVTVTQSREIEELVNSANVSARTQEPVGKPSNTRLTRTTTTLQPKSRTITRRRNQSIPPHNIMATQHMLKPKRQNMPMPTNPSTLTRTRKTHLILTLSRLLLTCARR